MKQKKKLTQNSLKNILNYNKETGLFKWLINKKGPAKKGDIAGCTRNDGYIIIGISGNNNYAHILAWLYVYGYVPENDIDHIDRNPSNNKISNLREASRQCNLRNSKVSNRNVFGVKGVSFDKNRNKWVSRIVINGKDDFLGRYNTLKAAITARYYGEIKHNFTKCDSESSAYLYLKERDLL